MPQAKWAARVMATSNCSGGRPGRYGGGSGGSQRVALIEGGDGTASFLFDPGGDGMDPLG